TTTTPYVPWIPPAVSVPTMKTVRLKPDTTYTLVDILGSFPHLDRAVENAVKIILVARVFHDHVALRLDAPRPQVHPILAVGLRIVHGDGVLDRVRVEAFQRVRQLQLLAVRVAGGIELRVAVEAARFDDQRIAIPAPRRDAVPGLGQISRPLEAGLERHPVEPRVLLEEERERRRAVHDLQAMRRVDVARHAERQTVPRVVAVAHRVVDLPLPEPPVGVRQIVGARAAGGRGFRIGQRLTLAREVERLWRPLVPAAARAARRHT